MSAPAIPAGPLPEGVEILDWIEKPPLTDLQPAIHFPKGKRSLLILADTLDLRDQSPIFGEHEGMERRTPREITIVANRLILGESDLDAHGSTGALELEARQGAMLTLLTNELVLDYGTEPYSRDLSMVDIGGGRFHPGRGLPSQPGYFSLQYATAHFGSAKIAKLRERVRAYVASLSSPLTPLDEAVLVGELRLTRSQAQSIALAAAREDAPSIETAANDIAARLAEIPAEVAQDFFGVKLGFRDVGGEFMNAARRAAAAERMSVVKLGSGQVPTLPQGLELVPSHWLQRMYTMLSARLLSIADTPDHRAERDTVLAAYAALPRYRIAAGLLAQLTTAEAPLRREYRLRFPDNLFAGERMAWELHSTTLQVVSEFEDGSTASGYAFLVGSGKAARGSVCCMFATADHVVRQSGPGGEAQLATRVRARRYGESQFAREAHVVAPRKPFYGPDGSGKADLAILEVEFALDGASTRLLPLATAGGLQPGALVWFLGRAYGDWGLPSQPGTVESSCTKLNCDALIVNGLLTESGNSGAPFTSNEGLLGMHLGMESSDPAQTSRVYVLRIDRVRALVEQYWSINWRYP